jgi:hypothetical protein
VPEETVTDHIAHELCGGVRPINSVCRLLLRAMESLIVYVVTCVIEDFTLEVRRLSFHNNSILVDVTIYIC